LNYERIDNGNLVESDLNGIFIRVVALTVDAFAVVVIENVQNFTEISREVNESGDFCLLCVLISVVVRFIEFLLRKLFKNCNQINE
jgi:uncharacterized membrane protein